MPNVPKVSGVPALLGINTFTGVLSLLTGDAVQFSGQGADPQWGIFSQGGGALVTADSVISVQYKQDWVVSDYPVEQGAFASYDKVATPFDARVRFAMGGAESDREAMLASIEAIADKLDLYDVATPERTYTSVNIVHYDYQRTAENGVGLLKVDIWLTQIRETGTQALSSSGQGGAANLTNTANPASASPQNDGTVQAAAPPSSVNSAVSPYGAAFPGGLQ